MMVGFLAFLGSVALGGTLAVIAMKVLGIADFEVHVEKVENGEE